MVDKILRERADDIIDMDKAVRRVEAERHHQLPSGADEVSLVTGVSRRMGLLLTSAITHQHESDHILQLCTYVSIFPVWPEADLSLSV